MAHHVIKVKSTANMARGGRAVTAPRRFSEFVDDIAHLKLSVFAQSDENKTIYSSFFWRKLARLPADAHLKTFSKMADTSRCHCSHLKYT